jgi:hypothetical protein
MHSVYRERGSVKKLAGILIILLALYGTPALAEHNMEHVREETERLKELYLPPGYGNEAGQIVLYNPVTDEVHLAGLHGPMTFCNQFGGYWYDGEDGYFYWHSC